MRAAEAGHYLARRLKLSSPISAQQMWSLARAGILPTIRLGRKVFFIPDELDRYLVAGGKKYPTSGSPSSRATTYAHNSNPSSRG